MPRVFVFGLPMIGATLAIVPCIDSTTSVRPSTASTASLPAPTAFDAFAMREVCTWRSHETNLT